METITITSEKNRHYTALIDGKAVGTLSYPKWFSQDAEVTIGDVAYSIKGKGFWKTHGEVLKDGKPVYDVKTGWRGTEISKAKETHHYYTLKPKGWFKSAYVLKSYKDEEIMEIKQDFSWKKFRSGYTVTLHSTIEKEEDLLLVLAAVHYYRAAMNAAAAIGTA